jgi:putative RecB family exonuclease
VVRKDATPEDYREQGRRCLRDYFSRYAPFDGDKTLGLEMKLSIRIDGYRLTGYVDRVALNGGRFEVHDYKTSRKVPPLSFFEEERQLALYQIGIQDKWREAERADLVWHYLMQGVEVRSTRTPEMLEALKSSIAALIRRIEQAEREYDFPAVASGLCAWCEYRYLCPSCGRED